MGPSVPEVRTALARTLNLGDPGTGGHSARNGVAAFAAWISEAAQALGKQGEDLTLLSQSGSDEMRLGPGGGSFTMLPMKVNPVAPSVLVALARQMVGLGASMAGAAPDRDATVWLVELLTLPQMCIGSGRALATARDLADILAPDPARMHAALMNCGAMIELGAPLGEALDEARAFAATART